MKRDMIMAGLKPAIKWNDRKTVHSVWIGFPELLKEVGLAEELEGIFL